MGQPVYDLEKKNKKTPLFNTAINLAGCLQQGGSNTFLEPQVNC